MEGLSVAVCTAFEPTVFKGKKCYSLDVNDILDKENISVSYGKNSGLSMLIDTNPDRHFGTFRKKPKEENAVIYINTLEPLSLIGGNIAYP